MAKQPAAEFAGVWWIQSGAVIPGVTVQATQVNTNNTYTTTTTSEGIYLFENLPIGDYRVVVEAKGFRKASQK